MKTNSELTNEESSPINQWERDKSAAIVVNFEEMQKQQSQRQFCESIGIPRSTLQDWLDRKNKIDHSPVVINFFEHPDGLAFLHRIQTAVHFVFNQKSTSSIRDLILFFELSGLSAFVAHSYGTQQNIAKTMETKINEFGQSEKERLTPKMPKKKISLTEDETFHPEICVVGMEPNSGFIFLEKYVEGRQ